MGVRLVLDIMSIFLNLNHLLNEIAAAMGWILNPALRNFISSLQTPEKHTTLILTTEFSNFKIKKGWVLLYSVIFKVANCC